MISAEDEEELDEAVQQYATDTTWSWVKSFLNHQHEKLGFKILKVELYDIPVLYFQLVQKHPYHSSSFSECTAVTEQHYTVLEGFKPFANAHNLTN